MARLSAALLALAVTLAACGAAHAQGGCPITGADVAKLDFRKAAQSCKVSRDCRSVRACVRARALPLAGPHPAPAAPRAEQQPRSEEPSLVVAGCALNSPCAPPAHTHRSGQSQTPSVSVAVQAGTPVAQLCEGCICALVEAFTPVIAAANVTQDQVRVRGG